jgi:predicted phosphoadenosine phosphosulfate sulfurtransferase
MWLNAWGEGEEWMRAKSLSAIHDAPGAPDRFYDFFPWYEEQSTEPTAFLVGLRSRESLNRWRAAKANPGYRGIGWSTVAKGNGNYRFYPIFDWATGDVWKYLADNRIRYNRIYDTMYMLRGGDERRMRVSFLVHEQSFRCLTALQELEPDTYERLVRRIGGVHMAALYADEPLFNAHKLPSMFETWHDYREYLLGSTPMEKIERLRKRFEKQGSDEATCREHVRQLLINDWENNVPVRRVSASKLREHWWSRL